MYKSNPDRTKETVSRSWRPGRIILKCFLLLLLLLSCLPFVLPRLINSDYIRQKALGLIGQELSRHIGAAHISMAFFPRPGFRLDGLALHPDETITIGIETAFLFPDIGTLFSRTPFPLTGELLLKQISLVSPGNTPATALPMPLEPLNGSTLKSIAIHFSYTSLQHFALNIRGSHLQVSPGKSPEHTLYARSLNADIQKIPEQISITLDPIQFDPPLMGLVGVRFHKDNTAHNSQLNFTGQDILVAPLGAMASTFFKKNTITTTIFDIIKGGSLDHIKVNFQNNNDNFLFDPKRMTIKAELHGGTIAIPSTQLMATDVTAMVQVENGILLPHISSGTVEEALIKKGTLQVDLLEKKHEFKGEFFLKANLAKLPGALQSLLPGTLLARELELTKKLRGNTTGTLVLNKTDGNLKVDVHCTNFDLTGSYQRFPGKTFQLRGNGFSFEKDKIIFKNVEGTIGSSKISQVSGKIHLMPPNMLDITSAQGNFPIQEMLAWLNQFQPIAPRLEAFSSSQGTLSLAHMTFKGPLSDPDKWSYQAQGALGQGSLYQDHGEKGISDISFSFDLLPHDLTLENIKGTLQGISPVIENNTKWFNGHQHQLYLDLQAPITLTNGTLKKTNQGLSFQCHTTFPQGTSMAIKVTDNNENFILEKLEIKDPPLSNAMISYHPGMPMTFKGKVNLKTIRQLFEQGSGTAEALAPPELHGNCFLSSGPEKGVSLFLEQVNMKVFSSAGNTNQEKNSHEKKEQYPPPKNGMKVNNNVPIKRQNPASKNREMVAKNTYIQLIPRPMHINVGTFGFKNFLISPLALQVFPLPTGTDVEIQESRCCGLPITGVIRKEAKTLKLTLKTDAQDLDFNTTLGCFMGDRHPIEGKYALKANLFSMSRENNNPQTQIISGFKGPFELYAQNGRIFQMTLLSRILSLINVSSLLKAKLPDLAQQGFAYDTMIFKGMIKESRIFIEKGVINGVDMTLLITGWIDPVGKTMDFLCFVSPLKSVDDLIQKLPIINTMFQGDLISIPITVKGDLSHPEVMALSPVEVTKGILNTLKDILTTPLTLLKKLP